MDDSKMLRQSMLRNHCSALRSHARGVEYRPAGKDKGGVEAQGLGDLGTVADRPMRDVLPDPTTKPQVAARSAAINALPTACVSED